jgi:hypothetical protein
MLRVILPRIISLALIGFFPDISEGQIVCSPDFIYVTPSGSASGTGTFSDPVTFDRALTIRGSSSRNVLLLSAGTYTLSGTKTIPASTVIDGRYTVGVSEWTKSSSNVTTLNIAGGYVTNGTGVGGYVAIEVSGNDVYIKDVNLTNTASISGTTDSRGRSVYGIHGTNASNLYISRSTIGTPAATNGANGAAGAAGTNGFNGTTGHDGDNDDHNNCDDSGDPDDGNGGAGGGGSTGGVGAIYCNNTTGGIGGTGTGRDGGGGGGGGSGGRDDGTRGGASGGRGGTNGFGTLGGNGGGGGAGDRDCDPHTGSNGTIGSNGTAGTSQSATEPATSGANFNTYFIPGAQSSNGTNGYGGCGGGGGGGGSAQSDDGLLGPTCDDGSGNGGGGGGGGGQGGALGTGGYGGGASIPVYLSGGSNKNILSTLLNPGTRGFGGTGGSGGTGGTYGNGGAGNTVDTGEVGRGGNGARGGSGGAGGAGGRGMQGVSQGVYNGTHTGTTVPNPQTITAAMKGMCTNSIYTLTKGGGTWGSFGQTYDNNLTSSSTSYGTSSSTLEIYYTSTGHKDVIVDAATYPNFLNVIFSRSLPTINAIANTCVGGTTTISTPTSGANYEWKVYSSNANSPAFTSSSQSFNWVPTAAGTYYVRLRVYDNCCGWSRSVHSSAFIVNAVPNSGYTTWIGGTSQDWHTASNWHCYLIPTSSDDVIIPTGTTYTPIIYPATTGNVRTIEIFGNVSLLDIQGDLNIHIP